MPGRVINIRAPSRLHFGMLSFGNRDFPQFGGVGVMVKDPGVELSITTSNQFETHGRHSERAGQFAKRWTRYYGLASPPNGSITVLAAPAQHVGLGTGTQLALSVATALNVFCQRREPTAAELTESVGRGQRSAVGTYGFLQGGLVAEAGKSDSHLGLGKIVSRVEIPSDWRFVLCLSKSTHAVPSGTRERQAFEQLPPVPLEVSKRLESMMRQTLIPSAAAGDYRVFSECVYEFGRLAGQCFASIQGGPFIDGKIESRVTAIRESGGVGVGQSSWGPTLFCLAHDQSDAERLVNRLKRCLDNEVTFAITRACNRGHECEVLEDGGL